MRECSRTLVPTSSSTDLCKSGTRICQAWSGWFRAPESSSKMCAGSKELPLMGLELLRHSPVQQAWYQNENASPQGNSVCAEANPYRSSAAHLHAIPALAGG